MSNSSSNQRNSTAPGSSMAEYSPTIDSHAAPALHNNEIRRSASAAPDASSKKLISLEVILNALLHWWKVAVPAGIVLAVIAGTGVYITFEPQFEASCWVMIRENTPYVAFESREDSARFTQTQVQLITSPLVLEKVLSDPEIASMPVVARVAKQVSPVQWLKGEIRVRGIGNSELYEVGFRGPNPKNAARIVNSVVDTYLDLRKAKDIERNAQVIGLLESDRGQRETHLAELLKEVQEKAEEATELGATGISTPDGANAQREEASTQSTLRGRLLSLEVEMAVLESEINAFQEIASQNPADIPPNAVKRAAAEDRELLRIEAQIREKRDQLEEILKFSALGRKDPAYIRLAKKIQQEEEWLQTKQVEVEQLIREHLLQEDAKQREETVASMSQRLKNFVVLHSKLQERHKQELKDVKELSRTRLEYEFKRSKLEREQAVYNLIVERTIRLLTEQMAPARVTKESEAKAPAMPVEATPYKMVGVAMMGCFFLPFGLAIIWERVHQRVNGLQVLEEQIHVHVVGEIVRLPSRTNTTASSSREAKSLKMFEESIDGLRTNLFLSPANEDVRIIAVVSSAENEGKTSVSSQLAVSIARATNSPTLLIDGDMRCPDIHNVFGVRRGPGLAEVLAGDVEFEDAVVKDWSEHLHILPAGKLTSSPHGLVGNGHLSSLFTNAALTYRYIVVDTPPILAASEALVWAKAADASLFCVMQDVSRVDQVLKAHQRLLNSGAVTAGTVVSGVASRQYKYRYGSYEYAST